jgi:radical SAM superfamily enzyme YgiQ (UPF0313 family)
LGPVDVGTAANKLESWDVEIIDENNLHGRFYPKTKDGTIDHERLQEERPADIVGFYGSMTSAAPRLYKLAALYKQLKVRTISGGYHVKNLPLEALNSNIDIVVMGEGETTIRHLLLAFENKTPINNIPGISFLRDGRMITTIAQELIDDLDYLAFPDFNLVRYAKIKTYPIGRIRGCNFNCEFCAVKDRARCSSPEWMMAQIAHLVETRGARRFFDVSDHFVASGVDDAVHFCNLLSDYQKKTGIRLRMTIQIRINDAVHKNLLEAMKEAGIDNVCIGIESCIDEELLVMRKGYREKDILKWIDTYHGYGFFIHGMMIFGYPEKPDRQINMSLTEKIKRFKEFVRHLDTAQVLLPVPLPGTELTDRLRTEGRLYDIDYQYYDGQFPLFEPDGEVTPEELQYGVQEIMGGFYHFWHLGHLIKAILIHFPLIVFPRVVTLTTLRVRYLTNGFRMWHQTFWRTNALRFGGNIIVRNWKKSFQEGGFLEQLEKAKDKLLIKRTKKP